MSDATKKQAAFGVSGGHDALVTQDVVLPVQSQRCLAASGVRAVTFEAGTGEDGSDVQIEVDGGVGRIGGWGLGGPGEHAEQNDSEDRATD